MMYVFQPVRIFELALPRCFRRCVQVRELKNKQSRNCWEKTLSFWIQLFFPQYLVLHPVNLPLSSKTVLLRENPPIVHQPQMISDDLICTLW